MANTSDEDFVTLKCPETPDDLFSIIMGAFLVFVSQPEKHAPSMVVLGLDEDELLASVLTVGVVRATQSDGGDWHGGYRALWNVILAAIKEFNENPEKVVAIRTLLADDHEYQELEDFQKDTVTLAMLITTRLRSFLGTRPEDN